MRRVNRLRMAAARRQRALWAKEGSRPLSLRRGFKRRQTLWGRALMDRRHGVDPDAVDGACAGRTTKTIGDASHSVGTMEVGEAVNKVKGKPSTCRGY